MSASTTKKNRVAARAEGSDKKTVAARKEAEKKRKDKVKWTIIGCVVFVFIVAIIYLNSGMFFRNATAVSVDIPEYQGEDFTVAADTVDFSVAEVNYMFRFNYNQFMNSYGSYASMFGLDSSKPLKSQECTMTGEEDYTWYDYFMDSAKSQLQSYALTAAYAKAAGIEVSDEALASIDETVASLTESAKENGYNSLKSFLSTNYGRGCNEQVFRDIVKLELVSEAVQDTVMNAKDYSAQEIKDHYATIADDYDNYSYAYYLVAAETEEAAEGEEVPAPTDEAMAAAKETAQQIKDAVEAGDLESAVIAVCGEDVVPVHDEETEGEAEEGHVHTASTTMTDVQGQTIDSAIAEWLKSENRQAGEMEVIESEGVGYYVVIFNDRHTVTEPTEESGDVPYCDYIAEQLLRGNDLDAWNEAVFSKLAESASVDKGFGARYVG